MSNYKNLKGKVYQGPDKSPETTTMGLYRIPTAKSLQDLLPKKKVSRKEPKSPSRIVEDLILKDWTSATTLLEEAAIDREELTYIFQELQTKGLSVHFMMEDGDVKYHAQYAVFPIINYKPVG